MIVSLRSRSHTLEKLGYTIMTAFDGASGLKTALATPCHLVILDIMLPVIDGWEVCKAIRENCRADFDAHGAQ